MSLTSDVLVCGTISLSEMTSISKLSPDDWAAILLRLEMKCINKHLLLVKTVSVCDRMNSSSCKTHLFSNSTKSSSLTITYLRTGVLVEGRELTGEVADRVVSAELLVISSSVTCCGSRSGRAPEKRSAKRDKVWLRAPGSPGPSLDNSIEFYYLYLCIPIQNNQGNFQNWLRKQSQPV